MKNFILLSIGCLAAILIMTAPAYSSDEKPEVAKFSKLSGSINYDREGVSGYREVGCDEALKMALIENDIVASGNATGEVVTTYGARIDVKANTEFQIGFYNLRIKRGGAWIAFKADSYSKEKKFKVTSPGGSIGIKGTELAVYVFEDDSIVIQVREGLVDFMGTNASSEVDIAAGGIYFYDENGGVHELVKAGEGVDIIELINEEGGTIGLKSLIEKVRVRSSRKVPAGETGNGTVNNPWKQLKNK